jgi:hypothetical protein
LSTRSTLVKSSGCSRCALVSVGVHSYSPGGVTLMRSFVKAIGLLCLLLTVSSAWALTSHDHSNPIDAAKCTVCVAAHSASPQTILTVRPVRFVAVSTLQAKPVAAKQRLLSFALSVRPPPAL